MRFLECLKSAGKVFHGNSYLWSMMKKSSVSRMQKFMYSQIFRVMSWKDESEPNINYCLGAAVGMVQRFTTMQNFEHNRRRTYGIRVEYFPRIHHIATHQQSPRVHDLNGRPITIPRTNYLDVDVQ